MRWLLDRFGYTLGFALLLLGIFWAPQDILDWEQAAEPWQRLYAMLNAMLDREKLLWVVSGLMLARLASIDIRPWVQQRLARHDIIAGDIECRSILFRHEDTPYFRNVFLLPIINTARDAKTLYDVKAFTSSPANEYQATFWDASTESVNLNSGERGLIYIGESISTGPLGMIYRGEAPIPSYIESYIMNKEHGHQFVHTSNAHYLAIIAGEPHDSSHFPLIVHVFAQNTKSKLFRLEIKSEDNNPFILVKNHLGQFFEPHTLVSTARRKQRKNPPD